MRTASGDTAPVRTLDRSGFAAGFVGSALAVAVTTSPPLAAAVLPGSRSVQVGAPATAFAALINAGPGPVQACHPTPITPVAGTFEFQATNAQNQLVGSPKS